MFVYSHTPRALLQSMSEALSQIRDPRARHWLVMPKRGRAEYVIREWADRTGIASHTQEVTLRELIEQAASGTGPRFDFEQLRLAVASALPDLRDHPRSPIPKDIPHSPISAVVLDWAGSLSRAIDETMLCRRTLERWEHDSFLHAIASHPAVAKALKTHIGSIDAETFDKHARLWMFSWAARGGIPHLWIQLDGGLPMIQLERFDQFLSLLTSTHVDRVHLYAISPSVEYWGESELRRRKRRSESSHEATPENHPGGVLWAFGRCSQDLHRQLSESLFAVGDGGIQANDPEPPNSLLGAIHRSCRSAASPTAEDLYELHSKDASLTVHASRSTLRELETCRDRILQAMQELPDLRYEEILILLADPKRQAPFIEAALRVNDSAHGALPFRLLGFGQSVPSAFTEAVCTLLQKIRGRLSLEDLQVLIENPLIASHFGFIDAAEAGRNLVGWLQDAQFRWGASEEHRGEHQKIEESRWNLSWAVQRLGLGALSAPKPAGGVLELPNGKGEAVPLERASGLSLKDLAHLANFAAALERARKVWTQANPLPLADWNAHLKTLITEFLDCSDPVPAQHLSKLTNTIMPSLNRAANGVVCHLSVDGYLRLLDEKLKAIAESGVRGPGGICVADLREHAGVPARMILIAGLDADTFPRGEDRPSWHPLSARRKNGDPSLRDAERHAMLLALIACEERLVLSYQGGSDEDGKDRPPSTALADLLQAVDSILGPETNDSTIPKHSHILFRHPLNGFSPSAFYAQQPPSARGFLRCDFEAANTLALRQGLPPFEGLWRQPLPHEPIQTGAKINLRTIHTLLSRPTKILLKRLGTELPDVDETLAYGDLLELDGLEKWPLRDALLSAKLEGKATNELHRVFTAAGVIPRSELGDRLLRQLIEDAPDAPDPTFKPEQRITRTLRVEVAHPADSERRYTLEGELQTGWYLDENAATPRYHYYSASKKDLGKELKFLVDALVLAASLDERSNGKGRLSSVAETIRAEAHFRKKQSYSIPLPSPDQARSLLGLLMPLLEAAKSVALPLWPKSFEAIFKKTPPSVTASATEIHHALEIARESWESDAFGSGPQESDGIETQYAFRGCSNPFVLVTEVEATDFLPAKGAPLSWRLAIFLHEWKTAAENLN